MTSQQYITSSRGNVQVAYLKKQFKREPGNVTVDEGQFVSLPCTPPEGNPDPEVYWTFNNERVQQDTRTPDNALIIESFGAENAGTYRCVATNLANTRTSHPAIISVNVGGQLVTGAPVVDGSEPDPDEETEPEYEPVTPKTSNDMMCLNLVTSCSGIMPQTTREDSRRESCLYADRFAECLDKFIARCEGLVDGGSIKAARDARRNVLNDCGMPNGEEGDTVCNELMTCQSEYSQKKATDNQPMLVLCSGIQDFLRCTEGAAEQCGIPNDKSGTTLGDLADWFDEYCDRVVDDAWTKSCDMSQCVVLLCHVSVLCRDSGGRRVDQVV
ncbi:uncharacterized protein [Littorina saxatilis]|uniref:uncharacterized protein n=1 Tax=Littorina saxatilis TaxID=31220 RepID=UPI0038B50D07